MGVNEEFQILQIVISEELYFNTRIISEEKGVVLTATDNINEKIPTLFLLAPTWGQRKYIVSEHC